jgi:hypothetical protein
MKYALLIHPGDGRAEFDRLDPEAKQEIVREFLAIADEPGVEGGHQLHPPDTATTVQVREGRTLTTDGPFIEAKEAIGGLMIYNAPDLDAAIELAARIPTLRLGATIEVRPLVER